MDLLRRLLGTRTFATVREIFRDAIQIISLLAALSAVRYALDYAHIGESFKELFSTVHEHVLLGVYLLLALKSAYRIALK
jgi:hypothetical protein